MIKSEKVIINNVEYNRTYSDEGVKIERDGQLYDEAVDPLDIEREYVESDIKIESEGV